MSLVFHRSRTLYYEGEFSRVHYFFNARLTVIISKVRFLIKIVIQ